MPRAIMALHRAALALLAACAASRAQAATPAMDVFLIAGQSNATGEAADASRSPRVKPGEVLQFRKGALAAGNDPVGKAHHGSAWPAFGIAYHAITGCRVLFVPEAVAGASLLAGADLFHRGNWGAHGSLFGAAIAQEAAAMRKAGAGARFAGVLWDQGEAEGSAINAGFPLAAEYQKALRALIARFRHSLGPDTPIFIFRTGAALPDTRGGFAAVRAAQEAVAHDTQGVSIVFRDAADFPASGKLARDKVHYTQAGYNEMGRKGAVAVAAALGGPGRCAPGK